MDEIRQRVQLFSALRGAQRALARCIHPARLALVRSEGRDLLIRLQALGALSSEEKAESPEAADRASAYEEALQEVDALLASQLEASLALIEGLEFDQLRAMGPRLSSNHPEEVGALVDVMLRGEMAHDKPLRLVEYLVTMLSTEEWNGRRTVVREPSDVTAGLRDLARVMREEAEILPTAAETTLAAAEADLIHGGDLGKTRDEMREYKKSLGRHTLHPRILSAVVSYNAAMWNQVAAQLDTSIGMDQLADDLLSSLGHDPDPNADSGDQEGAEGASRDCEAQRGNAEGPGCFGPDGRESDGFRRIVCAFGERLEGGKIEDAAASRVVARLDLDGLGPSERAAFAADEPSPAQAQVRDAAVLGCLVRRLRQVSDALEALDVDPLLLEAQATESLMQEMNRAARRLFADSRYTEAFELSEVRTRNLASLATSPRRIGAPEEKEMDAPRGRRWGFDSGLTPGVLWRIAGPLLGLGLLVYFLSTLGSGSLTTLSPSELAEISPFLESGHHRVHEEGRRFVGELGPTWEFLGTPERHAMAKQIATHLESEGIATTVLLGPGPRVMAAWEDGKLGTLIARKE